MIKNKISLIITVQCHDIIVSYTVCPGSSDSFYIASLLYEMVHYFLDILYMKQLYHTLL